MKKLKKQIKMNESSLTKIEQKLILGGEETTPTMIIDPINLVTGSVGGFAVSGRTDT